jgi:hypothetical protein
MFKMIKNVYSKKAVTAKPVFGKGQEPALKGLTRIARETH